VQRAKFLDRAFDACANLLPVRHVEFHSYGATILSESTVLRFSSEDRNVIIKISVHDIAAFPQKRVCDGRSDASSGARDHACFTR
jgi:hypothetical protein